MPSLIDQTLSDLGAPPPQGQAAPVAAAPPAPPSAVDQALADLSAPPAAASASGGQSAPAPQPAAAGPSLADRFLHGVEQPFVGAAQLLSHNPLDLAFGKPAAVAGAPTLDKTMDQFAKNWEQRYQAARAAGGQTGIDFPEIAGNVLSPANLAGNLIAPGAGLGGRLLSGALSGGLTAALQPVENAGNFGLEKLKQLGEGAALGAPSALAAGALARVVQPNTSPEVQMLRSAGVNPTPGQILGGAANRMEEGAQSIPLLGDFIKSGRARAVEQFDRGAINQALAPIGESLSDGKIGRDAILEMNNKISDAYKAAVPAAGAQLDQQAIADFGNLHTMAQFMPADRAQQFNNILQGKVLDKISPNGGMTGESFKEAESDLGKMASGYLYGNNTSDERQLGGALREAQSVLRNWLGRANPQAAGQIQDANRAYAMALRVGNAAGRVGGEPGAFSPAQLQAATKALAPAKRFQQGTALMQPYAEAGKTVLGAKVPDSGTPFRSMATILGGALLGHEISPEAALGAMGLGAGAAGVYSPLGQRIIGAILASRPSAAAPAANAVRGLLPSMSGAAAPSIAGGLLATP